MSASYCRRGLAVLVLGACLPLAACGTATSPQSGSGSTGGDTTVSPTEPPDSSAGTPPGDPSAGQPTGTPPGAGPGGTLSSADILRLAVEDLSAATGVAVDDIAVVRNEQVTWPDSSLGCPQEGSMYLTVLTPGHLVVLEAAGTTYEYHSGQGTPPALCEDPKPPLPPGSSGT